MTEAGMPLYEYECRSCQHTFEELVFGGEQVTCPACQGRRLERLMSVPARPQLDAGTKNVPMACRSEGPPCGRRCARSPES
jgi:putative FmdB family regulatory protein